MEQWQVLRWEDQEMPEDGPAPELTINIREVRQGTPNPEQGYLPLEMVTDRGVIAARFFPSPPATTAVIWVGGAGGGFDTPAGDLYGAVSRRLQRAGVASLWLRYRFAGDLDESVLDTLAGVDLLESLELPQAALVGHSFGGAVAICAAALSENVTTVATLAAQSYGTALAARLEDRALLLIHGGADPVLSPHASESIAARVRGPKRLVTLPGVGHTFDEAADEVEALLFDWLTAHLREAAA